MSADEWSIDEELARLRRKYLRFREEGVTHAQMAEHTGLPESTFSMWLSGYRNIVKVEVVRKLGEGVDAIERMLDERVLG